MSRTTDSRPKRRYHLSCRRVTSRLGEERVSSIGAFDDVVVDHAVSPTLDVDVFGLADVIEHAMVNPHAEVCARAVALIEIPALPVPVPPSES